MRPDRETYALGVAAAVGVMGDCTRRRVGAVIVDTNKRIAGAGYNGTYPGGPSCLAGQCDRGRHYRACGPGPREDSMCICDKPWPCPGGCACGDDWPCPDAVAPGSNYRDCIATHAEMNAVADVDNRARLDGATLYVTTEPCEDCVKHIRNTTRIQMIRWPEGAVALP